MKETRPRLSPVDFLATQEHCDARYVYALKTSRCTEEHLHVEHWRSGVARTIATGVVCSVKPLGIFLNDDPGKPLVQLEFSEPDSPDAKRILSMGDPTVRNVTLVPFPSPPGGVVYNVPAVEFFAQLNAHVTCSFSPLQPPPPYRPLERMAALYKNDYAAYYDEVAEFHETSPTGTISLDSYDYYWAMAAFTRVLGGNTNWQASSVANISSTDNQLILTFIDAVVEGGITGGTITIESRVQIDFD